MKSKNVYLVYAALLAMIVFGVMCLVLFNHCRFASDKELSGEQSIELMRIASRRGTIFDRNMNELAIDMPVSRLVLDISAINRASKSDPDVFSRVNSVISPHCSVVVTKDSLRGRESGYVVLSENSNAFVKNSIENDILRNNLVGILYYEVGYDRVYRDASSGFRKLVGGIDPFARNGLSGIEREYDAYLLSSRSDTDENECGSVQLTVDYDICKALSKKLSSYESNINIAVFDRGSGGLLAFYSNCFNQSDASDLGGYLGFPKAMADGVFNSVRIAGMLEADPTLIEEYYCDGSSCADSHGLVNLSNMLSCQAAIRNLSKNNYNQNAIAEKMAKFNILSQDLQGLYSLGFLAYSNDFIPPMRYVIKTISNDGTESYAKSEPGYKVVLSDASIGFLRNALSRQSKNIRIFRIDECIVIFRQDGGVEDRLVGDVSDVLSVF